MHSNFDVCLIPNRMETKSFCVHAFVRSNQESQSSQIFWDQNFCAFMHSCIQKSRYGLTQIELRAKTSAFMRSCVQTSFSNFLPSKFLCVRAFMRSNFEIWLNPNRTETKNLCVHAFKPVFKFFGIKIFVHSCIHAFKLRDTAQSK